MNFMMSIRNSKCFWSGIRHHVDALKCWLQILQVQLNPNQFFFFSGINSWRNWPESGWCAWSERCAGSGDGYLNYSLPSFDSDVCRWWLPCWKGLKNSIITMVTTAQSFKQKPFYPVTQKHAQLWTLYKAAWIGAVKGAGAEWGVASGARAPNLFGFVKVFQHIIQKYLKRFNAVAHVPTGSVKRYHQLRFLSLLSDRQRAHVTHTTSSSYIATPPANHSALHSHASCQSISIT